MSFYTSLTGLNAATAELGIVSNNIANVGTIGFKKSRAEFGDIFATSPLQNASSSIGQGVLLKGISQEFSQGNVAFSQNSLDMAIQGQGFFVLKPNLTSNQTVYTRNGSFRVNNDRYVVDSSGQYVQVFPVNDDGSVVATGLNSAKSLQLPSTAGLPRASSKIDLGVNLPADAEIIPQQDQFKSGAAVYRFDRNDPNTFNRSTSITVFDSLGNPSIATIYYVKVSNATIEDPTNKWQTYIYVGDREIKPALLNAKTDKGETLYIDKFGQQTTDPATLDPTFNPTAPHPLYYLNDQNQRVDSEAGRFVGGSINVGSGYDFGSTDGNKIRIGETAISTGYSGTFTKAVAGAAADEFNIDLVIDGNNYNIFNFAAAAANDEVTAVDIDDAIADLDTDGDGIINFPTDASDPPTARIGYTGTALAGNLTFYAVPADDGTIEPFEIQITSDMATASGGFAGADFELATTVTTGGVATVTGNTIGSGTEKQLGFPVSSVLRVTVDGSDPVNISLPDSLRGADLTGTQLASELTKAINNAFSDEQFLDVRAALGNNTFRIFAEVDAVKAAANGFVPGDLDDAGGLALTIPDNAQYTPESLVAAVQSALDAEIGAGKIKVTYDSRARGLSFKPLSNLDGIVSLKATGPLDDGSDTANETLGLPSTSEFRSVGASPLQGTLMGGELSPNGEFRLNEDQRRNGIQVQYQKDQRKFVFLSGTTGEASSITIEALAGNERAGNVLGITDLYSNEFVNAVGSGLAAKPAVTTGSKAGVDITGTFAVTANDNVVNVTVDGIDGTIRVPPGNYTGSTFAAALQQRINQISTSDGRTVNGVTVTYDADNSRFIFKSGTTSESSFINVNGHPNFGLSKTTQERGEVPKVTILKQATDADGNLLYIDKDGNETTQKPESLPNYTPIYLTKGQLTFDTTGRLISPKEGARYTPFDPQNGADLITLNVDYGKFSTQYSQPFSVLSLTQDGFTSGRLDGISIDSSGVIRANYTNGQQEALGKLILANFASPNGLKQIGNANYVATSNSGPPIAGEAGSDGFGTIQGGALERANVDLTEELVQLITAQRNFQANAKAIETATNLTSTIVNIRG
jgi:flagellar hook-basal body protein